MRNLSLSVVFCIPLMLSNQCKPSVDQIITGTSDTTVTISKIQCLSDTTQTYAVALPSDFNSSKRYPVVFVFDPHGDGHLAVKTFQTGATEFGYIIAGSNVIRNGYDRIEYALQALTHDVTNRYPVDDKRMYAAGFSGGGRVAQLFSQLNPNIRAVVSAGAGYSLAQNGDLSNKPSILFIVGNEDFNYLEIMNAGNALSASGIHYYVLEYPGKHAWPGRDIIHEALQWFEFDACRKDPALKQESAINRYKTSVQQQETLMEKNHDLSGAILTLEKGIAFLSGLTRTHELLKKLETLKKSPGYQQVQKQKQDALALEMRLQQGYTNAFTEKDTLWWQHEIHVLDERITFSDNTHLQHVYKRIKNFISIAAFSYCNRALSHNELSGAEKYVAIYQIVDPGNPDVYYFKALLFARKGKDKTAIQCYKKAVVLGFNDLKKAKQELPEKVYSSK
jgi:dienelactone hydrolase